jgi:hypothetical protein
VLIGQSLSGPSKKVLHLEPAASPPSIAHNQTQSPQATFPILTHPNQEKLNQKPTSANLSQISTNLVATVIPSSPDVKSMARVSQTKTNPLPLVQTSKPAAQLSSIIKATKIPQVLSVGQRNIKVFFALQSL